MLHYQRNSPLFDDLLGWIREKRVKKLRGFFPLIDYSTWQQLLRKERAHRIVDLDKERREIRKELLEDLYFRHPVRVCDEDNDSFHRRDNLRSCLRFYRNQLRETTAGDFIPTIKKFRADFQKAAPGLGFPSWLIDGESPLLRQLDELERKRAKYLSYFKEECAKLLTSDLLVSSRDFTLLAENDEPMRWDLGLDKYKLISFKGRKKGMISKAQGIADALELWPDSPQGRRDYALSFCDLTLWILRTSTASRGRQPKPFNVLVFHLIKRCTHWKCGPNRAYLMRSDGQHRLETDWYLVLFLALDTHEHECRLPELAQFIRAHHNEPAAAALKRLQARFLNIYKNFRPIHGWPMNREGFPEPETGFRRTVVTADGGLRTVRL